ncbi:thioredoxin domain-containing protein [Candidatus Micrarchaeota archaeon]|nr:thioredoxin domain-containing protein [Candidatus Micrarchaeota archaeon]
MLEETKQFLKTPFNKYLVIALLVLGLILLAFEYAPTQDNITDDNIVVDFFFSPTCPHCAAQKIFNEKLMEEFPNVKFIYHDITIPAESTYLQIMAQNHSVAMSELGVPATFIGDQVFIGFVSEETSGAEIRAALEGTIADGQITETGTATKEELTQEVDLPFFGKTDLSNLSLPMLAVVLGLLDGFNPCAMWVLIYLIALLMGLNCRKKMMIVVGTFVLSSGILYFLFMTAWLNVFLFLSYVRAVTIIVGLVALGGGILSIKDYLETKGAPVCKVTDAEDRKKMMDDMKRMLSAPLTWATMGAIVILAFTVNSVEFLCSFALPAVFTQVLALSNLSFMEYYLYIGLYDLFFMLDDMIIFGLAAWTLSGTVGEEYSKYCKIIGGSVLLILGILLLFAPQLLG